jgi:pyruvate kinase
MLGKIAAATEGHRPCTPLNDANIHPEQQKSVKAAEALASVVQMALHTVPFSVVFVPSSSGNTARKISRYKLPVWIVAFSDLPSVCQVLHFSYGVYPLEMENFPEKMSDFALDWMNKEQLKGDLAILVIGPSKRFPEENYNLQFLHLDHD